MTRQINCYQTHFNFLNEFLHHIFSLKTVILYGNNYFTFITNTRLKLHKDSLFNPPNKKTMQNIYLSSEKTFSVSKNPNETESTKKKLKAQNMLLFSTINTLLYFGSLLDKNCFIV